MTLLELLQKEPLARERKHKNRAIGRVIEKNFGIDIEINKLTDIVGEILTLDRQWRKILEENPELRGEDYAQKAELEQKSIMKLGYEPGFTRKTLFK